ncbi:hypothetical protein GOP47_0028345 [Adiantum capillus-veneris]|nr:hypothetical protein GOP47_0028345 [Adiantum capillus-veneris]
MQALWYRPLELLLTPKPHFRGNLSSSRSFHHQVNSSPAPFACKFSCKQAPLQRLLSPCLASPSKDVPNPADAEPLEIEDYDDEEPDLTKFDKIWYKSQEARKQEEKYYKENRSVFREAIGLDPNGEDEDEDEDDESRIEGPEIITLEDRELTNKDGDFFSAVDAAVASLKSRERASRRAKGVLDKGDAGDDDKDVEVASAKTRRFTAIEVEEGEEEDAEGGAALEDGGEAKVDDEGEAQDTEAEEEDDVLADPSFDLDFTLEEELDQIKEPPFQMTLSELLDQARVVPILVDGDQDVEITGIQYDSRQVSPGNMFVCGLPSSSQEHSSLAEAIEKGAVVVVASMEVSVQETVRAVVIVEDTASILSSVSAAFYGSPSRRMSVIGICGSSGKASASYLLKSMLEAMEKKTGLIGSIANYFYGKKKSESTYPNLDAISLHKLMATMVHNGTEACVMEVSGDNDLRNLEFDIAVFTNFNSIEQSDDSGKMQEKRKESISQLFSKMVDAKQHAKVVNIDDPYAPFVMAQGSSDVPVVTFSMENKEADVFTLDVQLSLFETDVLVHTPRGNVEISSGLLGRHNVYAILAAVAVGIAVNAPLEAIVQGIEEVDAVPGRCELIDEEQAFAVIVDHARTPDALSRLLDTVRECGARRLITVVGCEGECERGKRPVMAKIATDKSEVSILTSDNPRTEDPLYILDDMLAGIGWTMKEYLQHGDRDYYPPLKNGNRLFLFHHRGIAVRAAVAMGEEGDAVIIAGKGHKTFQLIGDKKEYLDDREECREALQHVDALHAAGIDTSEFPWRLPESH